MPIVTIPTAGQYGFVADQPAQELPPNAWTTVQNMRFRNGCAERFSGHVQPFSAPSVTPYFVYPYQTSTKKYIVHAGLAAVYADDGSTRTNITGTAPTGTASDLWTACVLGGVLVMNNGKDVPQYWAGTGTLASLTGWNANWRCGAITAFKNFLVAFNITKSGTNYPHMVKWSDAADPGAVPASWDETDATKLAGEQDIAETTDPGVDALSLGDALILYKQRSCYAMRFIGGTQVFEFRRIPGNSGMLAKRCAAVTPFGHVVLSNGDIVLNDGVNEPQSLIDDNLKSWLFTSQIDSASYDKCFVVANPTKSEVWVCYPEVGQSVCTKALVWNWSSKAWGLRDLPNVTHASSGVIDYSASTSWNSNTYTWDEIATLWNQDEYAPTSPRLLMASTTPAIYMADAGAKFDATAITATLERVGMAFDDPEMVKTLKSIRPRIDAPAGTLVYITFGASMDAEQAPTWGTPIPYTVGTTRKADGFATGRFLAVRYSSTGGAKWRIKSYSAEIEPRGMY